MIYRAVIVDDESYIADSTAVFLRSDCPWDMEIQVFYDPREALESIRSQKTDIVITDIRMPEVDGLEMLRQVSEFWPMCQVILLTAHAQFEYVYQAVGRPSADYVLKQDGYEALLAAVNRAVERINTTQVEQNILSTATERAQAALPWLQREFVLDLVHGAPYDGASLAATARQLAMEVDVEKPLWLLTVFLHDQSPNETLFERTQRSGALFLLAAISRGLQPHGRAPLSAGAGRRAAVAALRRARGAGRGRRAQAPERPGHSVEQRLQDRRPGGAGRAGGAAGADEQHALRS